MECLECDLTFPQYPAKCSRTILPGGIKGFMLAKCGTEFADYQDLNEWCEKISEGAIVVSALRRIVGSEPEAEEAVARLGSCDPDELLGLKHTLEIFDYNSEDAASGASQDLFYNFLNKNYHKLSLGFIACDDRFYGIITSFSVVAKKVIEADNFGGKTYWHIVFKWQVKDHEKPILIPGLGNAITNCTPRYAFRTFPQTPGVLTYGQILNVDFASTDFSLGFKFKYLSDTGAILQRNIIGMATKFSLEAFRYIPGTHYNLRLIHYNAGADQIMGSYDPALQGINTLIDQGASYYHIGLRKSGSTYSLFLNGILAQTFTFLTSDFATGLANLVLGARNQTVSSSGVQNTAEYKIDNLFFYNSVLTDAEMLALKNGVYAPGYQFGFDFNVDPVDPEIAMILIFCQRTNR